MKLVIWGTGYVGGKQLITVGRDKVDFFIDSNKDKTKKKFCGKYVLLPSDIKEWEKVFIYVPYNYYNEISIFLNNKGLIEGVNYCKYTGETRLEKCAFSKDFKRAINEVNNNKDRMNNKILFWGWDFSHKYDYKSFFKKMHANNLENSFAVIGDNVWETQEEAEELNEVPTVISPVIFDKDIFLQENILDKQEYENLLKNEVISGCVENLRKVAIGVSEQAAYSQIYCMLYYVEFVVDKLSPKLIIASNSRGIRSKLLSYVCKKKNIKLLYVHSGYLAGTYIFDSRGELGACVPNLNIEQFKQLPVTDEEIDNARKILEFLRISKKNRKIQPQNNCIEIINNQRKENKPIVFFAAQPDTDFVPYDKEVKECFTPNFKTSLEAGIFISKICKKFGWNYVYKPHPMYIIPEVDKYLAEGSIYIEQGDINDIIDISDVVVTIQSSTNYVALIRQKPVVMLGYNQTRGKGCTYEAFEKQNIEKVLIEALEKGYTEEQRKAFEVHITQSLKYYLYDDFIDREYRYGKEIPKDIEEFFLLEKMMIEEK